MYDIYYIIIVHHRHYLAINRFVYFFHLPLHRFDQEPAIGFGTGTRPPLNNPSG